jgi:DNA-binding transcriptional regulator YiaG
MKEKKEKNFIYTGLGFPVTLEEVTLIYLQGEWHPKIDVKKIAKKTMKLLASQEQKLTGNQIKFIRSYFSMSLRDFAKQVVHESHAAVKKWEDRGNERSKMDINIEIMLRLYIIEKLETNTPQQKSAFFKKYLNLKKIGLSSKELLPIIIRCA